MWGKKKRYKIMVVNIKMTLGGLLSEKEEAGIIQECVQKCQWTIFGFRKTSICG